MHSGSLESTQEARVALGYHLVQILRILNELRYHFEGIAEESERDIDSFEESATQPIVSKTKNEVYDDERFSPKC